jgi:uncharacterized membrane protein YhaH (DUF805 family)
MPVETCTSCGQTIGNFEKSFFHNKNKICIKCKQSLRDISITDGGVGTDYEVHPVSKYSYGGIGRLMYFLGLIGILVFQAVIGVVAEKQPALNGLGIITLVFTFFLVVNRLRNIGRSAEWSLLLLIPLANLYIFISGLILPEGYKDTKKLDLPGQIIAGIILILFILSVIIIFEEIVGF